MASRRAGRPYPPDDGAFGNCGAPGLGLSPRACRPAGAADALGDRYPVVTSTALAVLTAFPLVVTIYLISSNGAMIALGAASGVSIWRYRRRRPRRDRALARQLVSPPSISVIVPAYNEAV